MLPRLDHRASTNPLGRDVAAHTVRDAARLFAS